MCRLLQNSKTDTVVSANYAGVDIQ